MPFSPRIDCLAGGDAYGPRSAAVRQGSVGFGQKLKGRIVTAANRLNWMRKNSLASLFQNYRFGFRLGPRFGCRDQRKGKPENPLALLDFLRLTR